MYAKIIPSGCEVRNGNIKVRISLYLESSDAHYDKHFVQVLDTSSPEWLEGYKGELDDSSPIDDANYNAWIDSLPHIWQLNPFHTHFITIPDDTLITSELLNEVRGHLTNFYVAWANEEEIGNGWIHRVKPVHKELSASRQEKYQKYLDNLVNGTKDILIRL